VHDCGHADILQQLECLNSRRMLREAGFFYCLSVSVTAGSRITKMNFAKVCNGLFTKKKFSTFHSSSFECTHKLIFGGTSLTSDDHTSPFMDYTIEQI